MDRVNITTLNSRRKKDSFVRFYLGAASRRERLRVFRSRDSEHLLQSEWKNYQDVKEQAGSVDKDSLLLQIQKQIGPGDLTSDKTVEMPFFRKYAAIIVLGLVIASGGFYWGILRPVLHQSRMLEVSGSTTGISDIQLPDGSRVSLSANSTLHYPEVFSRNIRQVFLSGEAYFDVESMPDKAFLIHTENVDIEVLGTTFNVKAHQGAETVETTLVSGKVRITRFNPENSKTQSVILTPNHQAVFFIKEERFVMDKVDVRSAISWHPVKLSFDDELLGEALKRLGVWYDVQISLRDDVPRDYSITMTVDHESLEEVLTIIQKTLPLDYKKIDDEIQFYPSSQLQ